MRLHIDYSQNEYLRKQIPMNVKFHKIHFQIEVQLDNIVNCFQTYWTFHRKLYFYTFVFELCIDPIILSYGIEYYHQKKTP